MRHAPIGELRNGLRSQPNVFVLRILRNRVRRPLTPRFKSASRHARLPSRKSLGFGATVFALNAFPQEEVLHHKLPLTPYKRATADPTGYLAVGCLRPSFDFDDLIEGFAVRASKCVEAIDTSHDTPPIPALPHRKLGQEHCHAPLS